MTLNVLLEEGEDGWIVAHVPALRGCVSQGETRQAALANIKEAIEGWLEVEQEKSEFLLRGTRTELVAVAV